MDKLQFKYVIYPIFVLLYKTFILFLWQNRFIMNISKENIVYTILEKCGLRPSIQRILIMEYLLSHNTHPTVEDVYHALSKKCPTLSRTTVYNTLRLLSDCGAVQMITIDEHRVCYDGLTESHAHFYCKKCGKIMDVKTDSVLQLKDNLEFDGNIISDVQLYYRGICCNCKEKL